MSVGKNNSKNHNSNNDKNGIVYICEKCDRVYRIMNNAQKNLQGELICSEDGKKLLKYKRIEQSKK
ncbi:MAG: hypothetical protein BAJALOKI3v1_1170005 [Promethearchaeota archaeon]|nr:MAG: hypothetical protein BAJALOKI3v1_1170005 [Candidatus Lokiarchaeota archaeon]